MCTRPAEALDVAGGQIQIQPERALYSLGPSLKQTKSMSLFKDGGYLKYGLYMLGIKDVPL